MALGLEIMFYGAIFITILVAIFKFLDIFFYT